MIGTFLSHYKILEKLGEGGMGVVYKAQDTKLDRIVALKFLPQHLTTDAAEQERFVHEARAASSLNHPNITTIHEIDEVNGKMFIVMEYCEGKTLRQIIESEDLSIRKVLDIAIQTCEGLALAHEKGIVHRDIKSDNIILTPRNQVKIMDFGLAKLKGASKLTKAGSTLGTAAYMSPEQAQGEDVDRRSDIFSFGIVLYELLARQLPFRGDHMSAVTYAIMNEDPQPIARFNNRVSPRMEEIVFKALAKDPDERYQHIDDLLADLRRERKALEYMKTGDVKTAAPPEKRAAPGRSKLLTYGVPTVTILVLVVLMIIFNPFNLQISPQKIVAAEQNSVAVMYFENIPDPQDKDHTGEMLVNLMITSLSQVRGLDVISREHLYDIQKDLGHGDAMSITPSLATQIAQRAGVRTMLLGSILQKSPDLVVTSRLIDVKTGKILGSERLGGYTNERIFALVDSLASLVRGDLNLAGPSAAENKPVADVTTIVPEAYRSFVEGRELYQKYYFSESEAAFRRATDLDKNFAMAYYGLYGVRMGLGDISGALESLKKAWPLSSRVTERERLQIQAAYASALEHDYAKAAALLGQLLQKYPRTTNAALQLANTYWFLNQHESAREAMTQALATTPLDKELVNTYAYMLAGVGQKDEALRYVDQYLNLAPAEPNPFDSKAEILFVFGDVDSALQWWDRATGFRADFTSSEKIGWTAMLRRDYAKAEESFERLGSTSDRIQKLYASVDLALIPAHRGRFKESTERIASIMTSKEARNADPSQTLPAHELLYFFAYEIGDYGAMTKQASELVRISKAIASTTIGGRDFLAWALLKNGDEAAAKHLLDEVEKDNPVTLPRQHTQYEYIAGLLAFDQGKYDDALNRFMNVFPHYLPNHTPQYFYAVTLLKTGRVDEAIREFQQLTWKFPISFSPIALEYLTTAQYWPIAAVKAHYWLGVAYEQKGDNAMAIKEYQEFLDTWKDADKELPVMVDARTRLERIRK